MKFKKHLFALALLAVIGLYGKYVISGTNDLLTVTGKGSLWGIEIFNIDANGDATLSDSSSYSALTWDSTTGETTIYSGDLVLSGEATTPDSANAGTYPGVQVRVKNTTGAAIELGDVLCADATTGVMGNVRAVSATSTTTVVGVAAAAAADGATVLMTVSGFALVKSTGTVFVGDVLVSSAPTHGSSPKGYAGSDSTPTTGADLGVAMESATATDLILIRLR